MPTPRLTEALIRRMASEASFHRGTAYYRKGAVLRVTRRGDVLQAEVEGSAYKPYRVRVELGARGVVSASCSCPYEWGDLCKHIVAVLLTYIREPDTIQERPPVEELLAELSREELQELLTQLIAERPHLTDWLEGRLAMKAAVRPGGRRLLDPAPFRRQAQAILNGLHRLSPSEAYRAVGESVEELRRLVHQADPFLEAGDGRNALILLEAVAEVYVRRWMGFDDSASLLGSFLDELGELFAEALLSADLSRQERRAWGKKLAAWQAEVERYGVEVGFRVAMRAAEQGWEAPHVRRALQGKVPAVRRALRERSWYEEALTAVRLRILERQGRFREYLHLARATGRGAEYAIMLVRLGRFEEAVEFSLRELVLAEEALRVAQALRECGRTQEALAVAEGGLRLPGHLWELARWLRDLASSLGETSKALQAARIAFEETLTLEDYQAIEALAGEGEWPAIRRELLRLLASPQARHAPGRLDIYLHEGMVEAAIQALEQGANFDRGAPERVVEAATESHPDWAIRQCKKWAEAIMDRGESSRYPEAVRWLERARKAYKRAGRMEEWRAYLEGLIRKHARKRALRPRLEALRQ